MSLTEKEKIKSRTFLNGLTILTIPSWLEHNTLTIQHACRIFQIWLLSKMQIFLKSTLYFAVCHMERHRLLLIYQSPSVLKRNAGRWISLSTTWKLTMLSPTLITGDNQRSSQKLEDCWSFCSMLHSSSFFAVLTSKLFYALVVNMNSFDSFYKYSGFSASRHFRIWRVVWSTAPSSRVAGTWFLHLALPNIIHWGCEEPENVILYLLNNIYSVQVPDEVMPCF